MKRHWYPAGKSENVSPCVFASVCVLLGELNEAAAASSESSGVGSGEGNWMLVRSGSEPPVLWAAGFNAVVNCRSGVGNMLQKANGCSELHSYDRLKAFGIVCIIF